MYTRIKTPAEIVAMRHSGRLTAMVLVHIKKHVGSGQTGKEVALAAARELKGLGGKPAFLGYHGYPDVVCISINDEVVHGVPDDREFKDGDLVGFDFGTEYGGMITDAAFSMVIGKSDNPGINKLLAATQEALSVGIKAVKAGVRTGDIGAAIEAVLKSNSLGIIRDLVGHGVGHELHEDPNIPNYGQAGTGDELKAGMTIAIEPMATLGGEKVEVDADRWTIHTADRSLAAHFEHTVLITENGGDILTA